LRCVSSVACRRPAVVLSTVPVESGFSAFVGSSSTIGKRCTTIVFGLTAFRGPRLSIL
jgi:hypothetical protein